MAPKQIVNAGFNLDCPQSPIFPWSRWDRSLSSSVRHLGFCMWAKPGESTKCPWVGGQDGVLTTSAPTHGHFVFSPGFARIQKPRWRTLELNDRSQGLHGKIGDCEQSRFNSKGLHAAYFLYWARHLFALAKLAVFMIPRAMLAGALAPGGFNYAGLVKEDRPDKWNPLVRNPKRPYVPHGVQSKGVARGGPGVPVTPPL